MIELSYPVECENINENALLKRKINLIFIIKIMTTAHSCPFILN